MSQRLIIILCTQLSDSAPVLRSLRRRSKFHTSRAVRTRIAVRPLTLSYHAPYSYRCFSERAPSWSPPSRPAVSSRVCGTIDCRINNWPYLAIVITSAPRVRVHASCSLRILSKSVRVCFSVYCRSSHASKCRSGIWLPPFTHVRLRRGRFSIR